MQRKEFNLATGETTIIDLTQEEVAALEAAQVAALPARREKAINALKAKAVQVRGNGIQLNGLWFRSDNQSLDDYVIMRGANGDLVPKPAWRTLSGETTMMDAVVVKQLLIAGVAKGEAIDVTYSSHKAAILASDNPESYDFSTGWPAGYVPT